MISFKKERFYWNLGIFFTFLLLFVVYFSSLHFPFQFDDISNISKNFDIRNINLFKQILNSSRWFGELINRLNFKIGSFDPFSYRLFNLLIHFVSGVLVLLIANKICLQQKWSFFLKDHAEKIAWSTMLLFLFHPLQTQTVAYVIQARLEGLASCLSLLFVYSYLSFAVEQKKKMLYLFFGLLSLFLACGSKELSISAPFLAILLDWVFVANFSWSDFKKRIFPHSVAVVLAVGLMVYFFGLSFFAKLATLSVKTFNNRGNIVTADAKELVTSYSFLLSQFKALIHYLINFVYPVNLCVEYSHKLESSLFTLSVFVSFITIFSTTVFFGWLLFQKNTARALAFGYFWFLIAIFPRASINPSAELVCDYKTYLASFGIFFLMAIIFVFLLLKIKEKAKSIEGLKYSYHALPPLFLLVLSAASFQRTKVWRDPLTFWQDIIAKNPTKARCFNNYAVALTKEGNFDQAIAQFEKAIELDPYYADPLSNVAVLYSEKNMVDKAILHLQKAIVMIPNYAEGYNNLAAMMLKINKFDEAEPLLRKALEIKPYYGKAHFNLGRFYLAKGEKEKAWQSFNDAVAGDLDSFEGFNILGQMSMMLQKYEDAEKAFLSAEKADPKNLEVKFNLANAYFLQQKLSDAKRVYKHLVKANKSDFRFLFNLGETYFAEEKYAQALAVFSKLTGKLEEYPQAMIRIANSLEKLKKLDDALLFLENNKHFAKEEEFKTCLKNELGRLRLQKKINAGGCSINGEEFQKLFSL